MLIKVAMPRSHLYRARYDTVSILIALVGLLLLPACGHREHRHSHPLPNVTEYLDRLDRPERDTDQKPAEVIQALDLKPGMSVADLGSGSGYFTRRFIDSVAPGGTVYAIDVEPKALDYIREHLNPEQRDHGIVRFVHADADNPRLPPASVDLLFLCNTYHHIENRTQYFARAAQAVRRGGRLAVIDSTKTTDPATSDFLRTIWSPGSSSSMS
jgi:arsenite methyltransferase